MAKIIEFCIPSSFGKGAMKWIPQEHKGKLIQFDMGAGRAMARISEAQRIAQLCHLQTDLR